MNKSMKKLETNLTSSTQCDISARKDGSVSDADATRRYFWQNADNRAALRGLHKRGSADGASSTNADLVSDQGAAGNLYIHRITAHKHISPIIYRRQKHGC